MKVSYLWVAYDISPLGWLWRISLVNWRNDILLDPVETRFENSLRILDEAFACI